MINVMIKRLLGYILATALLLFSMFGCSSEKREDIATYDMGEELYIAESYTNTNAIPAN